MAHCKRNIPTFQIGNTWFATTYLSSEFPKFFQITGIPSVLFDKAILDLRGIQLLHYTNCIIYVVVTLYFIHHFSILQALLESHDVVAEKSYEPSPQQEPQLPAFELPVNGMTADAIRMVGLRKSPNEPLVIFSIICYL
jgi:hypothetical protein